MGKKEKLMFAICVIQKFDRLSLDDCQRTKSMLFSNFFSSSPPWYSCCNHARLAWPFNLAHHVNKTLTLTLKTDVDISVSFCCCCFLWSCFELFFSFLPKNCINLGAIRPALEEIKPWAGYLQYRDDQHFLLASMSMG